MAIEHQPADHWKQTLLLMVCVQVIMSASIQTSAPFLPQFLLHIGVAPVAHVENWTGVIVAASALSAAAFAPYWGSVGDRTGRKAMVLRSAFASGVSMGLLGICSNPWEMLGVRLLSGAFSGFSSSAMSLVATQAPADRLGYALGWLSTAQIAGTLLGPLVGGVLADHLHDYRLVFFSTSVVATILATTCAACVRETRDQRQFVAAKAGIRQQLAEVVRHPDLAPMLVVIMLAQITAIGIQPVLPLFIAGLVGDMPWRATITGAAIAATGVAGILSAPIIGRVSDAAGYRKVLVVCLAGAACFTLPQAWSASVVVLIALRFGVGIFLGGILPSANAIIGRMTVPESRGRTYGFTSTAQFLGRFAGPIVGGTCAARFGMNAVFMLIGGLMFVNLIWVQVAVRRDVAETRSFEP